MARGDKYWKQKDRLAKIWAKDFAAGVVGLCRRPHWKRLWVFQELARAQRAMVMCDNEFLPYDSISQFLLESSKTVPTRRAADRMSMIASRPALRFR